MGCKGCEGADEEAIRPFDAVFEQFWPKTLPFPPMTPWLAAVLSRDQARAWAVAVGAEQRVDLMAGDRRAMLDFLGRALLADGVFAAERKRKKKDGPTLPPGTGNLCCETARSACCDGTTSCTFSCSPNADGSCSFTCTSTGGIETPDFNEVGS